MTEPREPTDQLGIGAADMTDRTHPDSGRTTGGIVEMLQDRVAELEAQLEAIGAGGVSGPLMGRASLAASAGSEPVAADPMLLKFYGVTTNAEMIAAQAAHIERLQAKLPQAPSFAPQRVREG